MFTKVYPHARGDYTGVEGGGAADLTWGSACFLEEAALGRVVNTEQSLVGAPSREQTPSLLTPVGLRSLPLEH